VPSLYEADIHKSYYTLTFSRYVTGDMKFHNNLISYFRSFVLSCTRVCMVVSKPQLSTNIAVLFTIVYYDELHVTKCGQ